MMFDDIMAVYLGSSGDSTKAMYARLLTFAPRGPVAVKLLQACKASERAKLYRKSRYRHAAYDKKDWAISELCRALVAEPDVVPSWGWGFDPKAIGFEHVLSTSTCPGLDRSRSTRPIGRTVPTTRARGTGSEERHRVGYVDGRRRSSTAAKF